MEQSGVALSVSPSDFKTPRSACQRESIVFFLVFFQIVCKSVLAVSLDQHVFIFNASRSETTKKHEALLKITILIWYFEFHFCSF